MAPLRPPQPSLRSHGEPFTARSCCLHAPGLGSPAAPRSMRRVSIRRCPMPKSWSNKDERMYEHVKGSESARKNSTLAALGSDDPAKLRTLGRRYGVDPLFDYAGFRECVAGGGVDAVYIATPNSEHLPFARTAAEFGVHVLCEKPLAVTE